MIDIVKLANGNVAIYDTTSGDFLSSLSPDIVEIQCNINGTVKVIQDNGNVEYFDPAMVANTQVLPAAPVAFSGDCAALALLLSTDFFFVVSGGGTALSVSYNNSVSGLTATNVQDAIDEVNSLIITPDLNSVLYIGNSAGANDINLNGNDLLNVKQITDNSNNFGNYGDYLQITGSQIAWQGIVYTVELVDALTVDFYAPYDLKINTTTNIKNAPTITIQDDNVAYTLTNTIAIGSKITVTASVAGVTNLNITKA